ncbi:hypothetical protein FZC79_17630 [Rossellomorea vietnamensis]|uniref:ABM domain-containing protein n=2 Tax=Rossellomorea TaxID=2837508 RepID=A0A5D4K9L2_9BACI|nr:MULTISPECIES: hypothetical protein [Rossellomorea]TYR73696.1 hypothetical protein FZC79_17630 [Rossellomorea vietnamensis]TYS76982.1 hypothetical protein FZC80_14135 [Rossellomorea aquimaris]
MFVKVYQYHIQPEKEDEYLKIQERASEIYSRYVDAETFYFQSSGDKSKWMEITKYKSEAEYQRSIGLINEEEEIQELFEELQALLVSGKEEITEENFIERIF